MQTRNWVVMVLAVLTIGVMTQVPLLLQAAQSETFHCTIGFDATVRQGPSAGLALVGDLEFDLDSTGSVTGQFTLEDGTAVPLAGQINGRAVNLIFDLGDGKYIYGVGTALRDVRSEDCGGELGGPFVGPADGDSGDWGKGKPGRGTIQ